MKSCAALGAIFGYQIIRSAVAFSPPLVWTRRQTFLKSTVPSSPDIFGSIFSVSPVIKQMDVIENFTNSTNTDDDNEAVEPLEPKAMNQIDDIAGEESPIPTSSIIEESVPPTSENLIITDLQQTVESVLFDNQSDVLISNTNNISDLLQESSPPSIPPVPTTSSPPLLTAAVVASDAIDKILETTTAELSAAQQGALETIIKQPMNTPYFMCSACKCSYLANDLLGIKGARVKCPVCEKDWFQTNDRVLKTNEFMVLETMPLRAIKEVKQIIADKNWPKYPRINKQGIFVGNLPYTFDESNIMDLFAEYGLTGVSLVKDNEGQSKGFAFIEVSSVEDAELLIKEMHHFYTDPTRKLTVRSAQAQGERRPPPTGERRGGDRDSEGGSGGGAKYYAGAGGAPKPWVQRGAGGGDRRSY